MEQKKVLTMVLFVMAHGLLAITVHASSQLPAACDGYELMIDTCKPDLTVGFDPTTDCCFVSYYALNLAMSDKTGKGIINLCDCFQFTTKSLKYDPYKIIGLPDKCRIKISFPISMCVFWPTVPPTLVPKQ